MRQALVIPIILSLLCGGANLSNAVESTRPTVLIFDTTKGEGADKDLAASATKAIRTYFRETHRVEAALFDAASPSVLRAIMENRLTADHVASYSSRDQRLLVAKILQYSYAAGSEVSIKDSIVQVKLWLGHVNGGKKASWETTGSARSGGGGDRDIDNAMQSAASGAVREIERQALMSVARAADSDTSVPPDAVTVAPEVQTKAPTAADYASQAEASMEAGSVALAIQQYSQAVSADPSNASLRMKLADAYARKGLYTEAQGELGRAEMIGADADQVAAARLRIEKLKTGQGTDEPVISVNMVTEPSAASSTSMSASTTTEDNAPKPEAPNASSSKPANPAAEAVAKMVEGDKLWNDGKQDEAAEAYTESIKLNPNDWRAYERLAAVTAQMSLFAESRKALEQLNKVQPDPDAQTAANRYEIFRKAFDAELTKRLRDYDSYAATFDKHGMTRETYFNNIKGFAARLESMAKFLDVLTIPPAKQPAHLRRSLACGLLAQASTSLLDYLETNSEEAKLNAAVFVSQARKETEAAAVLEQKKVVAEKPPVSEPVPADESDPAPH